MKLLCPALLLLSQTAEILKCLEEIARMKYQVKIKAKTKTIRPCYCKA